MADEPNIPADEPGAPEDRKPQEIVDAMALAISYAESAIEFAMRRTGALPQKIYEFRRDGDIHISVFGDCSSHVGRALQSLGQAAMDLRTAHHILEDIRANAPDLPPATRGTERVTSLRNSGGGKN